MLDWVLKRLCIQIDVKFVIYSQHILLFLRVEFVHNL